MALNAFRNARSTPGDTPPEGSKDQLGAVPAPALPRVDENLANLEGQQAGEVQVVDDDKQTGEVVVRPADPKPC
jgi:hypothetical protein